LTYSIPKLKEKRAAYEKDQEKKKDDFRSGRIVGKVSKSILYTDSLVASLTVIVERTSLV